MTVNPFAPESVSASPEGYFGELASCLRATFLYREISIKHPSELELVYNGWWFRQRITLNGCEVWSKISWVTIEPSLEFPIAKEIMPGGGTGRIEIHFSRGLMIRSFRVWINEQLVYDGR
ncbi:MAG: hypothetical protein AAF802_18860 [Planctomycetota bacterium]